MFSALLPHGPLSPENNGNNVSKLGFVNNVSIEEFNIPPAETPKNELKSKTGVDCVIIFLDSSDILIAKINAIITQITINTESISLIK